MQRDYLAYCLKSYRRQYAEVRHQLSHQALPMLCVVVNELLTFQWLALNDAHR